MEILRRRRLLLQGMAALGTIPMAPIAAWGQAPLRMAYFDNAAPFSWLNKKSEMEGLLIDALNEALHRRMNIPLRHNGFPWIRAQQMVKAGDADAFCTVPTPERRAYTKVSNEPVIVTTFTIFARREDPQLEKLRQVKTIEQLRPFTIAAYNGDGWVRHHLDGMRIDWAPNIDSVLRKMVEGRGDVIVHASEVMRPRIKALGLAGELVELPQILDSQPFCLCIRNDSPYVKVLPAFDQTIRDMRKDGSLHEILRRHDALPPGVK